MARNIHLPGLWIPTVRGKRFAYYRASHKSPVIRIVAADGSHPFPGDPGFLEAFEIARSGAPVPEKTGVRSLAALITNYRKSQHWHELRPITQRNYIRRLDALNARFGKAAVANIDRVRVLYIREHFSKPDKAGKATTPVEANDVFGTLSVLLQHAINIGWRKDNPCEKAQRLKTAGTGYQMWTTEQFDQFIAADVGRELKLAVVVAAYTGLRVSDLVALKQSDRRNNAIAVRTEKTGARAYIPEHPELTRWLDASPPAIGDAPLLLSPWGAPWKLKELQVALLEAVRSLGLVGLSFHGLRKMLTAILAEGGATDAEIEAVIPHADPKMTRYYRKQADQKTLATAAIAKLSDRRKA